MLTLEAVWTKRGHVQVLRNVSFSAGNEVVAIIGLNGSGKTTTLRTISGLTPPQQGRIVFDGQLLNARPAYEIARLGLGYVQQSNQLFPELSVVENVRLGAYLLTDREAAQAVRESLDLFPALAAKSSLRAGHLSGGERQMLALAKTLAQRPKLLMLDEPTAGLSAAGIASIYAALGALRQRQLPILMVEQNVAKALEIADRVVILYLGAVHAVLDAVQARANLDAVRTLMMGEASGVVSGSPPRPR